ncbi:protein kinase domain-containing protein [Yinghuangia aomiensis]
MGTFLGSGAFGHVCEVRSDSGDLAVAKLFRQEPGAERELQFTGEGLRNVVPILDQGEHNGHWVIVMPRADKSLRDHLDEVGGPLPEGEAALILRDIAVALADLHGSIIHRDLKPENVLLLEGRWCVADFGISRNAAAATATHTRKAWHTPGYTAPEFWEGKRATSASDVYALGVIGYELLTGKMPFTGDDLEHQHRYETPPRLTSVSPCSQPRSRNACTSRRWHDPRPTACWTSSRGSRRPPTDSPNWPRPTAPPLPITPPCSRLPQRRSPGSRTAAAPPRTPTTESPGRS